MTGTSVCCCWCCSYSCCCCLLLLLLLQWQQKPRRDSRTAAHELEDGSRWRDKVGRTKPGSPKVVEGKRNRTGVLCCTLYQPTQKYHFKVCHWVLSSVLVFDMKLHYISHGNKLGVAMSGSALLNIVLFLCQLSFGFSSEVYKLVGLVTGNRKSSSAAVATTTHSCPASLSYFSSIRSAITCSVLSTETIYQTGQTTQAGFLAEGNKKSREKTRKQGLRPLFPSRMYAQSAW